MWRLREVRIVTATAGLVPATHHVWLLQVQMVGRATYSHS